MDFKMGLAQMDGPQQQGREKGPGSGLSLGFCSKLSPMNPQTLPKQSALDYHVLRSAARLSTTAQHHGSAPRLSSTHSMGWRGPRMPTRHLGPFRDSPFRAQHHVSIKGLAGTWPKPCAELTRPCTWSGATRRGAPGHRAQGLGGEGGMEG